MKLKHVGLCLVVGGALMTMCAGCTLLGPTDVQLTTCAGIVDAGLKAGTITKADATTYSGQMKASPPVLPTVCQGKV